MQHAEDILEEHLLAVEGACAYQSDGWFHARLKARMEAMSEASSGIPIRRASWALGSLTLLLALNLWTVGTTSDSSGDRSDPHVAFVQAYGMTLDIETE
ncbi:MAG: hypothetical protein EBZ67_00895 [Chitinophagia bacterium]|nr:hypothetical protein [Chitinophagia bacterium]